MSTMRQTVTSVTSTSSANHENNLDALLDDLQSSISRSGHATGINGGGNTSMTGFREVRRTVTDGTPGGTTTQYQIEYLHPANQTTHLTESSHQPQAILSTSDYGGGQNLSSFKEVSYNYHTAGNTSKDYRSGDARLNQNISELDSLLDDLNTAQQASFADSSSSSVVTHRNVSGVDPGLLEPIRSNDGYRGGLVEERHYREERRTAPGSRGRSSSPTGARRELVFTGSRSQDPSPIRYQETSPPVRQQQVYRYQKTTTTRTTGPEVETVRYPNDDTPPLRALNYRSPSPSTGPSSPPPSTHHTTYHYTTTSSVPQPIPPQQQYVERVEKVTKYRDPSPQRSYPGSKSTQSYSYSSTSREGSRGKTPPPPHRSPSPVSFIQPPPPSPPPIHRSPSPVSFTPPQSRTVVKTYHFEQPPPAQHSRTLTYNVSPHQPPQQTVSSYKYTTTTRTTTNRFPEEVPLLPGPFPTSPSPTPEQQPPKKLDELMASFGDTPDNRYQTHTETTVRRYDQHAPPHGGPPQDHGPPRDAYPTKPVNEKMMQSKVIDKREETKNVAGPPVYYPPGELFTKKEESMAQRQAGGGKYKEKSKYEYEASSKSRQTETSGKAIVPVCLPLCCGLPCVIM